jgi:PRTRC genetic system protein E
MLNEIVTMLSAGDRIQFEVARTAQGVRLTVTPLLADDPEKVPEEARATRAALALPLVVSGATAAAVEEALAERFQGYAAARGELNGSYRSLLDTLREASKEASGKALAKASGKAAGSRAATTVAATPSAETDEEDEDAPAPAAVVAPAPQAGDIGTLTF